ncbi:MAG: hypothetical protein V1884_02090 [Candidatus Omnitrophota bacterium]
MVYFVFRSTASFCSSLAAGILIDVDHIFDYYFHWGITLKIKDIYTWCAARKYRFVFLFLHSLDLVILLWITIWFFKLGVFWIAFAIGITQHMVLDLMFNREVIKAPAYFLTFRIIKGFRREDILK